MNNPSKGHEDCKRVKWKYNQFLCGNAPVCTGHSEADKKKASEVAKLNIAKNFFIVGILEQFIDTLHLFEKLMPKYYDRWYFSALLFLKYTFRAVEALNSETVQHTINMTKTQHKTPMNDASRAYFRLVMKHRKCSKSWFSELDHLDTKPMCMNLPRKCSTSTWTGLGSNAMSNRQSKLCSKV